MSQHSVDLIIEQLIRFDVESQLKITWLVALTGNTSQTKVR